MRHEANHALSTRHVVAVTTPAVQARPMVRPGTTRTIPIACFLAAVLLLGSCSSGTRAANSSRSTSSTRTTGRTTTLGSTSATSGPATPTTTPSVPPTAYVTQLPVIACATTLSITSDAPPSTLVPPTSLPTNVASRVAIYADTTDRLIVLAPRGWTCNAMFGADGSGNLAVYPQNGAPNTDGAPADEKINAFTDGGCDGCTRSTVCAYFPDLAEPGVQCRPISPTETVTRIRPHLDRFFQPPGVHGTAIHNPANGVIIVQEAQPTDWQETCTLPTSDHDLCTTILNDFIRLHPPQ